MSPPSVLLVEDDDDVRNTMREILEEYGFQVWCADNGKAALDLLHRIAERPSVIVLDLMMPVMSGEDFLRAVEHEENLRAIPVLICSAAGPFAGLTKSQPRINKPFSPDTLIRIVTQLASAASGRV